MILDPSSAFPRAEQTCRVRRHNDWFLQADCINKWQRRRNSTALYVHRKYFPEQWMAVKDE